MVDRAKPSSSPKISVPCNTGFDPRTNGLRVFIVGSPRSGTSVLLRAMTDVFGLPAHGESHLIPVVQRMIHEFRRYTERFAKQPADLLINRLPRGRFEDAIFNRIRDFYEDVYGGRNWADKTPTDEAVHGVGLIREIFPHARVIVTRRTGIEVVESFQRKFAANFVDACENWVRVMEGVQQARSRCPELLEVDQFDFSNRTGPVSAEIATYVGLPDRASHLADYLASDRRDQLSGHDWVRRLTLDSVGWPAEKQDMFRAICEPTMRAFGYPVRDSDLP